jgi:alpha-amylase
VIRGAGEPISPEQYLDSGQVFEFGLARDLKSMVESASLSQGMTFGPEFGTVPSESAIVFVDNHDTERNGETLSYADGDAYLLANAFLLAQPYGVPVLYSGYAFESRDAGPQQDDAFRVLPVECGTAPFAVTEWTCLQRDPRIQGMVAFHDAVGAAAVTDEWSDVYAYAFGREDYGYIVLNAGSDAVQRTFESSLAPGEYADAIGGESIVVAGDGTFTASVPGMTALAISVADYSPR